MSDFLPSGYEVKQQRRLNKFIREYRLKLKTSPWGGIMGLLRLSEDTNEDWREAYKYAKNKPALIKYAHDIGMDVDYSRYNSGD